MTPFERECLIFACPKCNAAVMQPCLSPRHKMHTARIDLYHRARARYEDDKRLFKQEG